MREFVENDAMGMSHYVADHRATHYVLTVITTAAGPIYLIDPDGANKGRWFKSRSIQIAWSYVREKLDLRDGDAEGWAMVFLAAGLEIFGIPGEMPEGEARAMEGDR